MKTFDQFLEEAEFYIDESDELFESVLSYLIDEGYADSEEEVYDIIENISDEDLDIIVESSAARRREIKQKLFDDPRMRKRRAPKHGPTQTIPGRKSVRKKPEGGWEVTKHPDRTMYHPRTSASRMARGIAPGGQTPGDQQYGSQKSLPKHSSAKVSTLDASKVGGIGTKTIKGSERGVKKKRGAMIPHPETKTQKRIKSKAAGPQPDPMDAIRGGPSRRI